MKHNIILYLIAIWVFSACSKDDGATPMPPVKQCNNTLYASLLPADTCLNFPDDPVLYFYHRVGLGYSPIGKSPSNQDEWFFLINREEKVSDNVGSEIWKVDTCSGRKQKLADSIFVQPKINQNGWILFMSLKDGLLYKIKENGAGLAAVSTEINNITFDWCLNGEAFFYQARFKDIAYLTDINGSVLDSFAMDSYAIAGRRERIALSLHSDVSSSYTRIAVLNLLNGALTDVIEIAGRGIGSALALAWESDDALIGAFGRAGLYRIHVSTGEIEPIKETCENLFYYYPVVDSDNPSWLILGKRDYSWPEMAQVYFTTNMVLYNTETGEEWKLDLDQ
ncbi:MAG: hypothetical protein J5I98_15465 [Phaeodactylibacter sp.]|nr:hypothetical protein [Phaeodactylibacter sp.]